MRIETFEDRLGDVCFLITDVQGISVALDLNELEEVFQYLKANGYVWRE